MLSANISVVFITEPSFNCSNGCPFVKAKFWSKSLNPFVIVKNKQIVIEDLIEEREAPEPHEGEEGVKDEEDNKK